MINEKKKEIIIKRTGSVMYIDSAGSDDNSTRVNKSITVFLLSFQKAFKY